MFPATKSNVDTETANTTRNLDSVTMKVCRVCLAMSVNLYHVWEHQLSAMYERVTGFEINTEDMLPKMLCWECVARLSSAYNFLEKASKTHWLLVKKLKCSKNVTMTDIESIDRTQHQLESTLGIKYYKENYSDFYIVEESDKIYEHQYNDNYNFCEDRKVESCELNNVEEPIIITEVNITDEKDPIKREYLDANEEENLSYDEYIGLISDEKHEFKFENLKISIKEDLSDGEVMDNISGEMSNEGQILCEDIKQSQKTRQRNWESEAPPCKELRVVVEDIMVTSSKHNTQDPLKQLSDTAPA